MYILREDDKYGDMRVREKEIDIKIAGEIVRKNIQY